MLTSMANELQTPGISTQYNEEQIEILWGRAELAVMPSMLLSGAARDAGNTPTTLLRGGLLLGKITSSGKLIQASPTATDGSQNIVGILPFNMSAQLLATNEDRWMPVITSGYVKAASLLIGGNANRGIAGDTYEPWVRTQLAPNFTLDDKPAFKASSFSRIEIVTADRTVVLADHGTLFVCYGGSANVNFTLPAMTHGFEVSFFNAQDYNMTVTATPADSLVTLNDAAADSIAFSTAGELIGASLKIVGLSNGKALALYSIHETQTPTIAS